MGSIRAEGKKLIFQRKDELTVIEPYGANCLRTRITRNANVMDEKWTVQDPVTEEVPDIVDEGLIQVVFDVEPAELDRISKAVTARFRDCRMSAVSSQLVREFGGELSARADFVESLLSRLCESQRSDRRMVELSGATNMLEFPEYSDVNKAKTFLATVEQGDSMYRMLKKASSMEFTVTIGSENEQKGLKDCSVVTASYRVNGTPVGSFGVIGPTRMDYARVLSILKNVQSNLGTILQSYLKEE